MKELSCAIGRGFTGTVGALRVTLMAQPLGILNGHHHEPVFPIFCGDDRLTSTDA